MNSVLQYLKGGKSLSQLAKRHFLPNQSIKEYYETVTMTRKALLDKILWAETFINDLDLEKLHFYVQEIAKSVDPNLNLYLPYHTYLYLLCRILKPNLVVETGVERGSSTFVILKALQTNGYGKLTSVELAKRVYIAPRFSVPMALVIREAEKNKDISLENWDLHFGNSLEVLPKLQDEHHGKVDIFVHGSDHCYEVQKAELMVADELVPRNGFIVVDRPDYNGFKAVKEAFFDRTKYSVTTLPEKSVRSPLMFSIVKKLV